MRQHYSRYFSFLLTGSLLISAVLPAVALSTIPSSNKTNQTISAPHSQDDLHLKQPSQSPSLPAIAVRRIKQDIAKRYNVPVSKLRISAIQERTWDGCFGLPDPSALCTTIAIDGRQVIITGAQRSWIYHTNANGSEFRLNETASLALRLALPSSEGSPQIRPGFISEDTIPSPDQQVVFQTTEEGGFAGRTVITQLNADGVISRQMISPTIRSVPVAVKRLTPKQVETFVEEIQQQRFNHLNRLSYSTKQGADLITTQILAGGTVVEYVDIAPKQLPSSLQHVIRTWKSLSQA
jgi:hypothetical protein